MEEGFLYTRNYPAWTQREAPAVFRAPKDTVFLRSVGDEPVSPLLNDPFPEYPGARLRRGCGLAVFPCNLTKK